MSIITFAESVGFCRFAFGGFVQLSLKWPFLPQRRHIGAGRLPEELAGRSGRPHCGRGPGFALALALAFGRGRCWLHVDLHLPFVFPFGRPLPFRPTHARGPASAGATTG